MSINPRLEEVLMSISSEMAPEEIDKRSRVQHRGRFSDITSTSKISINGDNQLSLFDQ
jgi:hypothetical protein